MKKVLFTGVVSLVLLGMSLAGCELRGTTTVPPPAPVTGGGVLTLYGIDPIILDPAVAAEMTSNEYVVQIFSGLVRLDGRMDAVPDIAARRERRQGRLP